MMLELLTFKTLYKYEGSLSFHSSCKRIFPLEAIQYTLQPKNQRVFVILVVILLNLSWFQGFELIKNIITTLHALFFSE